MNLEEKFTDEYQELCVIQQVQPSVFEAKVMLKALRAEIDDDALIIKGVMDSKTSRHKFVKVNVDRNGHTVEIPRMPTTKEIVRICHDLREQHLKEQEEKNARLMLTSSIKISEQNKANGQLSLMLIGSYMCCPDKVWALIDCGALKADLTFAKMSGFKNGRTQTLKNIVETQYKDVVELCKNERAIDKTM